MEEIKVGQEFKNHYQDRYKVADAYGGKGTPLPRVAHLELVDAGLVIKNRRPQAFISLTQSQVERLFTEVRPA
jgi:hypothetical protein